MKKVPLRKCVGCNEMKPKKELIRVLKTENDEITIDLTGKKNGRGAYICHCEECLNKAIKTKGIDRSLKVTLSQDVYEKLKKELNDSEAR